VHRDVSTGNVLWDPTLEGGRLSDLEFVKNIWDERSDDVKTGTPQFMAVEICQQRPLNLSEPGYVFKKEAIGMNADTTQAPRLGIRFHALHDIESIWWIAAWTLIKRIPESEYPHQTDDQLESQGRLADEVFPPFEPGDKRHNIFILRQNFLARTDKLNRMTSALAPFVSDLRNYLLDRYMVKPPQDIAYDKFLDVHNIPLQILGLLHDEAKEISFSVVPLYEVLERRRVR